VICSIVTLWQAVVNGRLNPESTMKAVNLVATLLAATVLAMAAVQVMLADLDFASDSERKRAADRAPPVGTAADASRHHWVGLGRYRLDADTVHTDGDRIEYDLEESLPSSDVLSSRVVHYAIDCSVHQLSRRYRDGSWSKRRDIAPSEQEHESLWTSDCPGRVMY
jgi:hypothetical protein